MRFGDGCKVRKVYARRGRSVEVIEYREDGDDLNARVWAMDVPGYGGCITADEWAKIADECHKRLHKALEGMKK